MRALLRRHWRKTWRVAVGSIVIVVGIILIPLPGPGSLVIIAGLAIMADEVPIARRMLDRLQDTAKKVVEQAKKGRKGSAVVTGELPRGAGTSEQLEERRKAAS